MGSVNRIECKKCHWGFEQNVGTGMMGDEFLSPSHEGGDQPAFYRYIEEKEIVNDIEDLLAKYGATLWEGRYDDAPNGWRGHGWQPYFCPKCSTMHTMFFFRLVHPDGAYTPTYHCPDCQTALKLILASKNTVGFGEEDEDMEGIEFIEYVDLRDENIKPVVWKCPNCGHDKFTSRCMICYD
jgi:hypothetical protein